jgi:hypothetical protein
MESNDVVQSSNVAPDLTMKKEVKKEVSNLKLVLDFLKWGAYVAILYYLFKMVIACAIPIVVVLCLAILVDNLKPQIKEEPKSDLEKFKDIFLKKGNGK